MEVYFFYVDSLFAPRGGISFSAWGGGGGHATHNNFCGSHLLSHFLLHRYL